MTTRSNSSKIAAIPWRQCGLVMLIAGALLISVLQSAQAQEAPIAAPEAAPVAAPAAPPALQLEGELQPSAALVAGERGAYVLHLRPGDATGCYGTPARPIDAVVVLDTSPSAGIPQPGSNLYQTQAILRSLWAQMDQPLYADAAGSAPQRSRLAIATVDVAVAGAAVNVRLPLTDTVSAVEGAIAGLTTGADSSFDTGIATAVQHLTDNARPEAAPVLIIVFHDSFFALQNEVVAAAQRALAANIQVFVIGNQLNIRDEEQISAEQAAPLLASSDDFFLNPTAQDLRSLFVVASGSDASVAARAVEVFSELTPGDIGAVIAQSDGGERLSDSAVRWRVAQVKQEVENNLRLDFRVSDRAGGELRVTSRAVGLDCNGFPFAMEGASGAPSLAASVTTPAPAGEPGSPAEAGQPPQAGGEIARPAAGGGAGGAWSLGGLALPAWFWWLLLLALLAAALLLLLLWWLLRRKPEARVVKAPNTPPTPPKPPVIEPLTPQSGATNLPGARSQTEAELRRELESLPVWQGAILTTATGPQRPTIAAQWWTSASAAERELPLRTYGDQYVWNNGVQEQRAPLSLLLDVVLQRIDATHPLLAVYTIIPSDNVALDVRIDESTAEIAAQLKSQYQPNSNASAGVQRRYWLDLRIVENRAGKRLTIKPTEET